MAELQFPNIVGQFQQGQQYGQAQRANKLAGLAYSSQGADRQAALGQLAGVDPRLAVGLQDRFAGQEQQQAQAQQAAEVDHAKKINGAAQFMLSAYQSHDPARIQGAYQAVRPYLAELGASQGKVPPPQWSDDMLPHLYAILGQSGGMQGQEGTVVAPGGVLVDKNTGQALYSNPSKPANAQLVDVPDGRGGTRKMLFDPQTGQLTQPSFGQGGQRGGQSDLDGINAAASQFVNSGRMTQQQAEAWLKQQYAKAGVTLEPAGVGGLGYNPPKQATTLSADEVRSLGLPEGTVAQRDASGKIDVVSRPPQLSQDKLADIAAKRQKAQQAQQDAVATFNDTIGKIDSLINGENFGALGTFTGDLASKIPHTGAADAKAQLDTIGNQSVLNTLSALKSLSSTGASGFGALSEKEGDILRNAAANLSTSQSNEALRQNLLDLRQKMLRARDRVAQQAIKLPEESVGQPQAAPAQQAPASSNPRATNPQTGETVELVNGQWVPVHG